MHTDHQPLDDDTTLIRDALGYAALGFRLFPLAPRSKVPLIERWRNRASEDAGDIRRWFRAWPDANLAIATGDGIVALDVDPRNGGRGSLKRLLDGRRLPETAEAMTGNGGRHFLLRSGQGGHHSCSTGVLPGIDLKGDGGYIVVEPSVHPRTGKEYVWLRKPEQGIAPMPAWLREALMPSLLATSLPRSSAAPTGDRVGDFEVLLAEAIARFPVPTVGTRHREMNRLIGSMVGRGFADQVEGVVAAWWAHFHRIGVIRTSTREATSAIRSSLHTTLANPRFVRAVGVDHIGRSLELRFDAWGVLEAILGRREGGPGLVIIPSDPRETPPPCTRVTRRQYAPPTPMERAFVDAWACYSAYKLGVLGEVPMRMTRRQVSSIMSGLGVPEPQPQQCERLLRKYVTRPKKPSESFELVIQTRKGKPSLPSEFLPTGVLELLPTVAGLAA